jgi:hypothetical protein
VVFVEWEDAELSLHVHENEQFVSYIFS